jgi:hypothetical protein
MVIAPKGEIVVSKTTYKRAGGSAESPNPIESDELYSCWSGKGVEVLEGIAVMR